MSFNWTAPETGFLWVPPTDQHWFSISPINQYAVGTYEEAQQFCNQHNLTFELVDPVTQELLEDGNFTNRLYLAEELDEDYRFKFFK